MMVSAQHYCRELGRNVRAARLKRGMTQEDMMDHGFSLRHYQRIEAGRSITVQTLLKLAVAFKVSPRDLLPELEPPGEATPHN